MSSIFDTVDTFVSRRKCKILEQPTLNNLFFVDVNSQTQNIQTQNTGTQNSQSNEDRPNILHSVSSVVEFQCNNRTIDPIVLIQVIWIFSVMCLLLPFVSFIYNLSYNHTDTKKIQAIPYDCTLFYPGLLITLPAISVYLFCCALYFYKHSKAALLLSVSSVFLFVNTIEYACTNVGIQHYNMCFCMLSLSLSFGIYSQYTFFSYTVSSPLIYTIYVVSTIFAVVLICLSTTSVIILNFVPTPVSYELAMYTRIYPILTALSIHIVSTNYTLFVINEVSECIVQTIEQIKDINNMKSGTHV
jgi:hypothetical protein